MTYKFTVIQRPYSYNSFSQARKAQYSKIFTNELHRRYKTVKLQTGNLYGLVYYIRSSQNTLDADNLSKPVWDALCNILFDDDRRIKHRRASILEAQDVSDLPTDNILQKDLKSILEAVEDEKDIMYIEVGTYKPELIEFGLGDWK